MRNFAHRRRRRPSVGFILVPWPRISRISEANEKIIHSIPTLDNETRLSPKQLNFYSKLQRDLAWALGGLAIRLFKTSQDERNQLMRSRSG